MAKDCIPVEDLEITPKKSGSFMSWFRGLLLGGMIGAGIAMLSTPRSGEENRQMLRDKGMELRDRAAATVEDTRQKANEAVRKGQAALDEQKQNVQKTVQGVKEGVRSYREQNPTDTNTGSTSYTGSDYDISGGPTTSNPNM